MLQRLRTLLHFACLFVCIHRFKLLSEELMQQIAAEMNLSETAFVQELDVQNSLTEGSRPTV